MPAPFFTQNLGEFTRLEGVYIFEKNPPAFVRGVFLGVVGIAGQTLRGPVGYPVEITSEARFAEVFGGRSYTGSTTSVNKVREFLMNKPFGKVVISRVAAAGAAIAEADFTETAAVIINVAASSPGAWGNGLTVAVEAASDSNVAHFNLVVNYGGKSTVYKNLDTSAVGNNNLLEVIGTDISNLVVVTKVADGRPDNAVAAALADTAGSDGTVLVTDYTSSGGPLDQVGNYPGVSIVAVADGVDVAINAGINSKILLIAQASSDRMFLIWNGSHTASVATVASDVASYRNDRVVYVYNSTTAFDADLGALVTVPPHSWLASIMSQTDVDVHPGEEGSKSFTGGISGLQNSSLEREDYITLRNAGISSWERDFDGGHLLVSAVTTLLTPGKTEITRRRMADFLIISVARRLRFFSKKKNTVTNRTMMLGEIEAFSDSLQASERVIEAFSVTNIGVNTKESRGQGLECIVWDVRLIGHMLHIVLKATIGTTVEISEG